jgi:hypothetical protein
LGAGASVPAGLPDVDTLTSEFKTSIVSSEELRKAYSFLEENVRSKLGKFDIEQALQALTDLTEGPTSLIQYFLEKPKEGMTELTPVFPKLKKTLKQFVRTKCQEAGDIGYLRPLLQTFANTAEGLDIFTMNYDPTIETACEMENLPYTDGFDPYWNPQLLRENRFTVRLHKVHGSVFWFYRGPGRFVKVPVKGDLMNLKFFTGENLSELLIYPALEKKTDAGPYPYILNALREKLWTANLLVVIGYGFRDSNVRNLVLDQMRANPGLWMMLVSRNASSRKAILCRDDPELNNRIVTFNADAKTFIGNRELGEAIQRLDSARVYEENTRRSQASASARQDHFWIQSLQMYRRIEHYSKVKEIGKELLFSGQYPAPDPRVEVELSDLSLRFGVEELDLGNMDEAVEWFSLFRDCCVLLDQQQLNNLPNSTTLEIRARERVEIRMGLPPQEKRRPTSGQPNLGSLKDDIDYSIKRTTIQTPTNKNLVEVLNKLKTLLEILSLSPMPGEGSNEYRKRFVESTINGILVYSGFYRLADDLVKIAEQSKSKSTTSS